MAYAKNHRMYYLKLSLADVVDLIGGVRTSIGLSVTASLGETICLANSKAKPYYQALARVNRVTVGTSQIPTQCPDDIVYIQGSQLVDSTILLPPPFDYTRSLAGSIPQ
jgi:hypothetical protein